jgi:hypothetical protein
MRSSLFELVIVTELQAAEAFSSLLLTKAQYSNSRLSVVKKDKVIIRISPSNFIAREIKTIGVMLEMKFTVGRYTQVLNKTCSQYKRISKFVLIV